MHADPRVIGSLLLRSWRRIMMVVAPLVLLPLVFGSDEELKSVRIFILESSVY